MSTNPVRVFIGPRERRSVLVHGSGDPLRATRNRRFTAHFGYDQRPWRDRRQLREITDISTDPKGNLYVTCALTPNFPGPFSSCQNGSVLRVSPDGLAVKPLVKNTNYAARAVYRGTTNLLYLLLSSTSMAGSYSVEAMAILN